MHVIKNTNHNNNVDGPTNSLQDNGRTMTTRSSNTNNGQIDHTDPPEIATIQGEQTNKTVEIEFLGKTHKINTADPLERSVINLSDQTLTEDELSILRKGLKFCPTPGEPNMTEIHRDFKSFARRMRLKLFFNEDEIDPSTLKPEITN